MPKIIIEGRKDFMRLFDGLIHGKSALGAVDASDMLVLIDEKLRKKIQADLLEMYLAVYNVCKKYDIIPYLVGGSALGAVRHQGFIPWDDDLDIGMIRTDYNKFQQIFMKELGDKYRLIAPNYQGNAKNRFPKIIKKNTLYREILDAKDDESCGLFLDIFILENVPDNALKRKLKGIICNGLEFIGGQVFFYEHRDSMVKTLYLRAGKTNYYIRFLIGGIFSFLKSSRWFDIIDKAVQYDDDTTLLCGIPTGRKHYFGEILEKRKLLPATYLSFEGYKLPVFKGVDYYLKNLYGDYMMIPPVEKRERHYIKKCKL